MEPIDSAGMVATMNFTELRQQFPRQGRLEWIGLRTAHMQPMELVDQATALADHGLEGDRSVIRSSGKRQVTLIQAEYLPVIANLSGQPNLQPEWLRRNLVISGINLNALKECRFYVGSILIEGTGLCHPCSRMEGVLGLGGYNAMRGHGGLTARILTSGSIRIGDPVRVESLCG